MKQLDTNDLTTVTGGMSPDMEKRVARWRESIENEPKLSGAAPCAPGMGLGWSGRTFGCLPIR